MSNTIDQQFIEFVVKSLVGNPDAVTIERRIDEKGVLLELTVDPEDLGRVIGKRGATAQSLRTLLRALGTKNDARYNLKIIDNGEPRPERASTGETPSVSDKVEPAEGDLDEEKQASDAPAESTAVAAEEKNDDDDDVVSKTRKELAELDDLDV